MDIEIAALRKDAERYRWIKSASNLTLRSDNSRWTRSDGTQFIATHFLAAGNTQYAPEPDLDIAIDAAMKKD